MASKSKMKIDQQVIKQFFIDHTEKIVMSVLGLYFCYLAYDSFNRPHFDKKSTDLQTLVTAAMDRTLKGPSDPNDKPANKFKIPAFKDDVDKQTGLRQPPETKPWEILPYKARNPRGTPAALPARDLVATPGRGAFNISGRPEGKHWIVVTGLVPIKDQQRLYDEKFKNRMIADDPQRDSPNYDGYFVERIEVDGGSGPEDWSKAKFFYSPLVKDNLDAQGQGGAQAELVDDNFTDPYLTFGLPPLLDGKWGKEIAHLPEIPISAEKAAAAAAAQLNGGGMMPAMPGNPRINGRMGGRGGMGPVRGSGPPPEIMGPNGRDPRGGGGVHHGFGGNDVKPTVPGIMPGTVPGATIAALPQYKLLRYYDFDVEPGKTYRYRVFLILRNPNAMVADSKVLETPADGNPENWYIGRGKEKFDEQKNPIWAEPIEAKAPWSDPSPLVRVPSDLGILAGKVEHVHAVPEPQGEINIVRWMPETGDKAITTVSVKRGKLIDLPLRTGAHGPKGVMIDFSTKDIVVDLRGGEEVFKKEKEVIAPGQILTMDAAGNLVIHDELDDAAMVAKFNEKPAGNLGERGGNRGRGPMPPDNHVGPNKPPKDTDLVP